MKNTDYERFKSGFFNAVPEDDHSMKYECRQRILLDPTGEEEEDEYPDSV
jgi:hypothetical protein